ncbi:MAG: biosynthetic-type acetolactate synthase large subunit [Oscillospiraceae bacterium]|nr:biosynthetic-type acetolactate synthase large subunit [Oscillospiraceae bacterium]
MKISGAQIVVEQLIANGATTVFGYPGGAVLALYDELYKQSDRLEHILTAHEQGAVHAADGYARTNKRTGVVIATSGPGATNLVTGIANAYLDSIPMVIVTGNVPLSIHGKDSFQEVDVIGITGPIVKHSFVVRDIKDLEHTLNEAFRIAQTGRRGPVLVDVPKSVQTDFCEYFWKPVHPVEPPVCPEFDAQAMADAIKNRKRPYIYAGGGVIASGASAELLELSKKLSAPVGLSMMGLTALPKDYPLNLGMCGMHGQYVSTTAAAESDLIIALGVRFSDRATGNVDEYEKNKLIIHIDIDNAEIGKNVTPGLSVCGDVRHVLAKLLPLIEKAENPEWLARIETLKKAEVEQVFVNKDYNPRNIIETVCKFSSDETVVATDVGQHQMWALQFYNFKTPGMLLTSGGLGAMGFGMGAAVGACFAGDKAKTVLFTGDGSFAMNLIELATAVTYKLPIVVILINNGALGLPLQWQHTFFEDRDAYSRLDRKTDFPALAKAFGAHGHRADSVSELEAILKDLPDDLPTVIDCQIEQSEMVFPMIPPGGSVKNIILRG